MVVGRPCKACGFGCIVGLCARAGCKSCGAAIYGGGGTKSSSIGSEPETGVGGIDSGLGLFLGDWCVRSLESLDELRKGKGVDGLVPHV